jgi:hypothetical protein
VRSDTVVRSDTAEGTDCGVSGHRLQVSRDIGLFSGLWLVVLGRIQGVRAQMSSPVSWLMTRMSRSAMRARTRVRARAPSLMLAAGVPVAIMANRAGHYSAAFTMSVYIHANDDGMTAGAATLGALYGTEVAS